MKRHVALQIPYHLARTPLAVLDAQLGKRLPTDAVPRRAVKQVLGALDAAAGRLIDGRKIATPAGTPAKTSAKAPVKTPVKRPTQTPAKAPVKTPAKGAATPRRSPTG